MQRIQVLIVAATVALALGACKGKEADCGTVGDKFTELMRASAAKAKPDLKKSAEALLPALKEKMIERCKSEQWTKQLIDCVAASANEAELEKCESKHDHGGDKAKPPATP